MDGALTFTHVCVDSSQSVLEHHRPFQRDPFIHLCVDKQSNCTTTPQILHPICKPAEREKTHGICWESNQGPPALAAGTLTTEPQLPTATWVSPFQL